MKGVHNRHRCVPPERHDKQLNFTENPLQTRNGNATQHLTCSACTVRSPENAAPCGTLCLLPTGTGHRPAAIDSRRRATWESGKLRGVVMGGREGQGGEGFVVVGLCFLV